MTEWSRCLNLKPVAGSGHRSELFHSGLKFSSFSTLEYSHLAKCSIFLCSIYSICFFIYGNLQQQLYLHLHYIKFRLK